jgi:DNA-binding NtrC family response regulator
MSKARILIVDDEEDLRDVLEHQLKPLGCSIELAVNGREAFAKVEAARFDAILSDISMPEMNGLEFLAKVRERGIDTPFVILTGFGDKAKAVEALRLGAFDFLEKPWEPELLRATMKSAVDLGSMMRELDSDMEKMLETMKNASEEQRQQVRKMRDVQRSLLLMRIHKNLVKKTA